MPFPTALCVLLIRRGRWPAFRLLRNGRRILSLLLLTGLTLPALAGEALQPVALLNFTARRADADQVQAFSRNLRETFMLDGRFEVVEELAMYETLAGSEGPWRLKQARALLTEGKKAYRAGQFEVAVQKLEACRALHRQLYSELSRSDELADLLLFQGLSQARLNKADAAKLSFLQMFLLDPAIQVQRAPNITPEAQTLLDGAREQERQTPLRGVSPQFASDIAEKLKVSYLVTGVMEGIDGESRVQITLQLMAPGKRQPVTTVMFELPDMLAGAPPAGSPIYRRIVGVTERWLGPEG